MTKTTKALVSAVAVVLAAGSIANAQSLTAPKGYINVNFGAQPVQRDLTSSSTFTVYQEDATLNTTLGVSNGPYFEFGGGYRVWKELTVGVGISLFSSTGDASTEARIPSPVFFNQFVTLNVATSDLQRKELGTHIKVSWFFPVSDTMDISISAGPSFVAVTQDMVVGNASDVPPGTQNINLRTEEQSKTGVGINVSVDGNYMFKPKYGIGIQIQYAGGSVDLESAPDANGVSTITATKFGGFQAGVGFRYRF